jgi:hypothetical protein
LLLDLLSLQLLLFFRSFLFLVLKFCSPLPHMG